MALLASRGSFWLSGVPRKMDAKGDIKVAWCAQAGMSAALACWDALCEEVIIHDNGGFRFTPISRGNHAHVGEGKEMIG